MLKLVLRHRIKIAIAVLVMAAGVLGVVYWGVPFSLRDADHAKDVTLTWLEEANPVFLLLAIAVLPLVGFPISPLLIMGGVVYGKSMGMLVGAGGVALNNVLGYGIAAWLREPVRGWLERRGINVPVVSRGDGYKIVLLLRVTPGLPATVQNYVLGLSGIPFWTFFWVSLPPQLIIVAGFVLTGGALFEGQWGLIILGVSLLLVFGIVGRLIHSHRKNKSATDAAEPDQPQR